jgi:sterol desaturase/sphingolipid hydroxylase (fatty acid hydroxylase superfamily)
MEILVISAIPVFTLLMIVEFFYGLAKNRNTYSFFDTLSNLLQGILSRLSQFVNHIFHIGIYTIIYTWIWGNYENPFWSSALGITTGLVVFDLCDYWFHRTEHESAIFWAAHVIHHQSKHYNLSVALRQVSTEPLLGFVFYLPLALMGMPPTQLMLTVLIILFYQFWVHTEHIGKLGWFDYIFDSPSNHRVHHAINPQYLDKNYGGFLMVWDHLFGTYAREVEPCVYGTKKPFESANPIWTICCEYASILTQAKRTPGILNKLRVVFKAPGWSVTDLKNSALNPKNAVDTSTLVESSRSKVKQIIWLSLLQFLIIVAVSIFFLVEEENFTYSDGLKVIACVLLMCWGLGAIIERRISYKSLWLINALTMAFLYQKFI